MIYTFKDLLISRSNPFEINLELEIRKLFERNTDYRYEIRKNDDKFGYDLQIYRYFINGGDWVRKDIAYIEALENYILLNTIDKKFTLHFTMKGIESQLPPELFLRIHRSFIVNKKLIKTIDESSLKINLGNTLKTVPVGKSYRNLILNDICVMNKVCHYRNPDQKQSDPELF